MSRKDHYVSQTYLRHFAGRTDQLVPYYKRERVVVGKPRGPKSVCYETEGDSNKYFEDPRVLDRYLPMFENPWRDNVDRLGEGYIDGDMKYELSGYIAFLRMCNPTAKRLGQEMVAGAAEPILYETMRAGLDEDKNLTVKTKAILSQLITNKEIVIEIEREFAHAQGIRVLVDVSRRLYCARWVILHNRSDIPFITSDYPAVLYYPDEDYQRIADTYVPVKPSLAIVITPDLSIENPSGEDVVRYNNVRDTFAVIKRKYVKVFNTLIVKSAENVVIHSGRADWIERLVYKYRNWGMKALIDHRQTECGAMAISRQQPVELR